MGGEKGSTPETLKWEISKRGEKRKMSFWKEKRKELGRNDLAQKQPTESKGEHAKTTGERTTEAHFIYSSARRDEIPRKKGKNCLKGGRTGTTRQSELITAK